MQKKKSNVNCESCMNYEYDEEYEYYVCAQIWMRTKCIDLFREAFMTVHIISLETNTAL